MDIANTVSLYQWSSVRSRVAGSGCRCVEQDNKPTRKARVGLSCPLQSWHRIVEKQSKGAFGVVSLGNSPTIWLHNFNCAPSSLKILYWMKIKKKKTKPTKPHNSNNKNQGKFPRRNGWKFGNLILFTLLKESALLFFLKPLPWLLGGGGSIIQHFRSFSHINESVTELSFGK